MHVEVITSICLFLASGVPPKYLRLVDTKGREGNHIGTYDLDEKYSTTDVDYNGGLRKMKLPVWRKSSGSNNFYLYRENKKSSKTPGGKWVISRNLNGNNKILESSMSAVNPLQPGIDWGLPSLHLVDENKGKCRAIQM